MHNTEVEIQTIKLYKVTGLQSLKEIAENKVLNI